MHKYHRLTLEQREEISRQLAQGSSIRKIARHLSRSPSTISREVNQKYFDRKRYRAVVAEKRARKKRKQQGRKPLLTKYPGLRQIVLNKLRLRWSPEQIAQFLKIRYPRNRVMRISHETIYSYLYVLPKGALKKELTSYLRLHHRHRRKKDSKKGKSSGIPELISIEERPKEVAGRIVPGHWEGDILVGRRKQSALGSLVERTSRTTILVPLKSHHAPDVRKAFAKEMKEVPKQMRLTLTYDRGREMVEHKLFTKATKVRVYFCHPKSPWERGTNENTNMLVRQFFPRKTDFGKLTRKEIKYVQKLLNERPRETLAWKTPKEVFNQLLR
jgi:IS30 family transposase